MFVVTLILAAICLTEDDKTVDPLASVESAVEHLIEVLEKRDYDTFFEKCIRPDDRDRVLAKVTKEEFVRMAKEKFGPELLRGLKEVKGKSPTYEKGVGEYSARANLEPRKPVADGKYIRFFKLDGRWYYSLF